MASKRLSARRVERALGIPGGTLGKTAMLEVEGDARIVVTGCQGILTCGEDAVCLRTPEGTVTICGTQLEMHCLSEDGATLTGRLERIEFSRCRE